MCKHEAKTCPRCQAAFECKVGDITRCQCYGLCFTPEEKTFITERFEDCLCRQCLLELKKPDTRFREKFAPNAHR